MENTKDNTDLNKNPSNEDNVTENNITDAPIVAAEPASTVDASEVSTETGVTSDLGLESETVPAQDQVETSSETESAAPVPEETSESASVTDSSSDTGSVSESQAETVPVTVVPSEAPTASSPETPAVTEATAPEAAETQFTPTVLNAAPTDAGEQSANSSVLSIANDNPHAPGVKKGLPAVLISLLVLVLGLGLGFVAAGATGFSLSDSGDNKSTEIKAPIVMDEELAVPKDATIIAECAKGRGKQYVLPKDIPQGPVYNVWNGKVIGIEYMLGQKDVAANKDFLNLPLEGVKYDHINIGLLSKGHSGFTDPHYHVDVFTISHEEASKITCQ